MYEFMNKKCFSRYIWIHACVSLRIKSGFPDLPLQDSHKLVLCTDSVICSVTSEAFTADSVCARLLHRVLLGSIPLWHKQAIVIRKRIHLTSKYCNMHKIMYSFC